VTGLDLASLPGFPYFGKVINETAGTAAPANANDGILNAAETRIAGDVRLTNNTAGPKRDITTTTAAGTSCSVHEHGQRTPRMLRD